MEEDCCFGQVFGFETVLDLGDCGLGAGLGACAHVDFGIVGGEVVDCFETDAAVASISNTHLLAVVEGRKKGLRRGVPGDEGDFAS